MTIVRRAGGITYQIGHSVMPSLITFTAINGAAGTAVNVLAAEPFPGGLVHIRVFPNAVPVIAMFIAPSAAEVLFPLTAYPLLRFESFLHLRIRSSGAIEEIGHQDTPRQSIPKRGVL